MSIHTGDSKLNPHVDEARCHTCDAFLPSPSDDTITGMVEVPCRACGAICITSVGLMPTEDRPAPRCEGRYPVPQTAPPRDEPFEVTYRCAQSAGHVGPHGLDSIGEDRPAPQCKNCGCKKWEHENLHIDNCVCGSCTGWVEDRPAPLRMDEAKDSLTLPVVFEDRPAEARRYSQRLVECLNAERWQEATVLLIAKVDELYRERAQVEARPADTRTVQVTCPCCAACFNTEIFDE